MKLHRRLLCVALVLVGSVALASVAAAQTRPDDRAGTLGIGAQTTTPAAAHPDSRAGIRGVGEAIVSPAAAHPDNRVGVRGVPAPAPASDTAGTDWRTIGIGVGAGILVVLLVAAVAYTSRHGGHRPSRPVPSH